MKRQNAVALWLFVVSLVVAVALWYWPHTQKEQRPKVYSIRVQVLDPQGQPIDGSHVKSSAGNEPHLLPDGWWEIQVPAAKVPVSGRISIWAEHEDWGARQADLTLGADPNPSAIITLSAPKTWLRGQIIDRNGRGLPGVKVSILGGESVQTMSGSDGRFELELSNPNGRRVRVRSERSGAILGDDFCLTGRDDCNIVVARARHGAK